MSTEGDEGVYNVVKNFKEAAEGAAKDWLNNLESVVATTSLMDIFAPTSGMEWESGTYQEAPLPDEEYSWVHTLGGAAIGTFIGSQLGGTPGAIIGAIVGGLLGHADQTHCCTAAQKYHGMSGMKVAKLRVWHRRQPIIWKLGYDIWGKIIADKFVCKYKWWGDATERFYDWFVKDKKTIHGALAIMAIMPMSYLIGTGVLAKQYLIETKGRDYATT